MTHCGSGLRKPSDSQWSSGDFVQPVAVFVPLPRAEKPVSLQDT